jgi:nicotinate phosphoribosyltransferase
MLRNNFIQPLLTDVYQITMAYAHWKNGRHEEPAVFNLFFRKNPFGGEYGLFGGLEELLRFVESFHYADDDIEYLKELFPYFEAEFWEWLQAIDMKNVEIWAMPEGNLCFPREPLIQISGPLAPAQILESIALNLLNFPTLVLTNGRRYVQAVTTPTGRRELLEFGMRRAQGPDGAVSASRYIYMSGFDGTSLVLAGKLYGIPVRGTMAHSYIQSHRSLADIRAPFIRAKDGTELNFVELVLKHRKRLGFEHTNEGELASFITYAQAHPERFLALVDTYDVLASGVPNFICVALALADAGYQALGIRIDSGDLVYLSRESNMLFRKHAGPVLEGASIVVSNDIDIPILNAIANQEKQHSGNHITGFGIGTNVVTCKDQPALGGVYKLVESDGLPSLKLSQDVGKVTIPGRKQVYRIWAKDKLPALDLIAHAEGEAPQVGKQVLCRSPFEESKRLLVTPSKVEPLLQPAWVGGKIVMELPVIDILRKRVEEQFKQLREDQRREVNPTPYRVSVTEEIYDEFHKLWLTSAPIPEI